MDIIAAVILFALNNIQTILGVLGVWALMSIAISVKTMAHYHWKMLRIQEGHPVK